MDKETVKGVIKTAIAIVLVAMGGELGRRGLTQIKGVLDDAKKKQ